MPKLDRYLSREFAQSVFAALIVLGMVSMGGLVADLLSEIARGKVPAALLLSQLGLRLVDFLPILLPLSLMLGLLMALGRLYRDSEMPVLAAVGVGPRRLLKPVLIVVLPVLAIVALCSLWLGPRANRLSEEMVQQANKNLLVSGLEPGRFTSLPGGGVVYVGSMSNDGTHFSRLFVHKQDGDRLDVTTAKSGSMFLDGERARYLRLEDGFRVEGPAGAGRDFRLRRYVRNELRLPDRSEDRSDDDPMLLPTTALFGDARPEAQAQLHRRITPMLLALAFALLAVPLARSSPRQARHGRLLMAFLAYLVGMNLMYLGTQWLAEGKVPALAGLWWLSLPMLALAAWLYFRDGQVSRPRLRLAKRASTT